MKKIKLIIELKYDDKLMHDGDRDIEAKKWFFDDILKKDKLILQSNLIGDAIGTVKVLDLVSSK